MEDQIQIRIFGSAEKPLLIYLPGLHGDWTLIGSFRRAVADRVRFVEVIYPRTVTWSLNAYAEAIERALQDKGICGGWILAESFGSQIGWQLAARNRFQLLGLVLAGGFVRHPARWSVWLATRLISRVPWIVVLGFMRVYALYGRWRYRHAPEVLADMREFFERRTEEDRQAARHRLKLIWDNDLCAAAKQMRVPVYALTGFLDPVVPWWPVRRWLRNNCQALRGHRLLWQADHTVLATAPKSAAEQILSWINSHSVEPC
jgi:pimeloyl-ACP methyl ester carboxylesterase